jgi:hypothetical protein
MSDPQLVAVLEARLDKFKSQMQEAVAETHRSVGQIEDKFKNANPSFGGSVGGGFARGLIGGLSIAGVLVGIKSLVDALAELGDRSQELRLPVTELQAMSMAAIEGRVRSDELNKALETFTKVSKQTSDEAKDFYKSLRNIDSGFQEAFKQAPTQSERLRILSQAMRSTTDEVKRAQLGLTAFGTDSERVTTFVAGLNGSLPTLAQRARELGISVDDGMVKKAKEAQTQLNILSSVIGTKLMVAVGEALPTLTAFVPIVEKVARAIMDSISSFVEPEARPTGTLQRELDGVVKAIENANGRLKELQNEPSGFVFRRTRETIDKDIAETQDKINFFQRLLEKYRSIIAQRQAIEQDKQEGRSGEPDPNAFKGRQPLNKQTVFDTAIEGAEKHIELIKAETSSLGQLNEARERARMVATLEAAAKKANTDAGRENVAVTEEQKKKIEELADKALDAAKKQREAAEVLNAFKSFGQDLSSGLQAAVFEGQKLDQVLQNILKRLAGRQLDKLFDLMANMGFTSITSGGGLSSIFKAEGGVVRGPGSGTSDSVLARLSNGEFVVKASETQRHLGLLSAINSGRLSALAGGGLVPGDEGNGTEMIVHGKILP